MAMAAAAASATNRKNSNRGVNRVYTVYTIIENEIGHVQSVVFNCEIDGNRWRHVHRHNRISTIQLNSTGKPMTLYASIEIQQCAIVNVTKWNLEMQ